MPLTILPQIAQTAAPVAQTAAQTGLTAAGASKGFMQALLGSPKGLAALGQGVGMLGKVAGMMIGGKKGAKIAQSAGMFSLISGLAPSIAGAFGPTANTGTKLSEEAGKVSTDFGKSLEIGKGLEGIGGASFLSKNPGGLLGAQLGINELTGSGMNFNTNLEGMSNITGSDLLKIDKGVVGDWFKY